jgi:hypothetical protein
MAGLAFLLATFRAWSADCVTPPAGLVAWWPGQGNANDIAGTNNGTLSSGASFASGKVGQAFNFDGVSGYVEVASNSNLNAAASFSIEGWIFPRQDRAQVILSKWADSPAHPNQRSYCFQTFGNRTLFFSISDWAHQWDVPFESFYTTNNVFALNAWSHVAAVYDQPAGARRIYVNGVKVAERIDVPITVTNSTAEVVIGAAFSAGPADSFFDGLIDELSFYSTALSTAEIQAIYNAGNAGKCVTPPSNCIPPPSGLVGWWPGEGNANDVLGTNNGTLSGGVTFTNGRVNQAFNFYPAGGTVIVPDSPSLRLSDQLTMEAWINTRTLSGPDGYVIVSKVSIASGNNGYQLVLSGNQLLGLFNSPGESWPSEIILSGPIIATGVWYHVAFTYDQSAMKLYCNGQPVATNVIGPHVIATSTSELRISGADNHVYFDGLIDEPSVYNRALSASEIVALYAAGSAGKCGLPPSILSQPQSQVAVEGSSVTFAVAAAGTPPLSYQWQCSIGAIAGATASSLTLTNVQGGQAGSYQVVVTNVFGSVTSSNAVMTVVPPPPCTPPPAGLISWWPAEGNAHDIAGTNNGTLSGGVSFTNGEVGQAFNLNGTSQYMDVSNSASLNPTGSISVEAWIYPRLPLNAVASPIVKKAGEGLATQHGYSLETSGRTGVQFWVYLNGGRGWTSSSMASLYTNQWSHLVGVFDGTNLSLYLNGALAGTPTAAPGQILPSGNHLQIGHDQSNSSRYFHGLIDEASVYNTALSAAQVQAIYQAGSAGKCRSARAATATASIMNGFVVGVNITAEGWGYTNTPAVRIIGGGGSGAGAVAVVSNGVVIAVNILDAGSGYTNAPMIVIAPPFIPQPTMGIIVASLLSFTNLAVGTNYQFQYYNGSTWSNVGAVFTAGSSTFMQYVPETASTNSYRLAITPVPQQAYATAQMVSGFVVGATVTSGGSGYGSNVGVSIVGGGGSGATASATVSGGVVTKLTITDAGIGYTSTPTILIAPPPATALWPDEVTQAMELDLDSLSPYENYQMEFAPVIGGAWTNLGMPVTPASTTYTQYVDVISNTGYFRVRYVP